MNFHSLSALSSPVYVLADVADVLFPAELDKIENFAICNCRMLILVCGGSLSLQVNGCGYEMRACSLFDLFDWRRVEVTHRSADLRAYCVLPTFEFTNEAMNGLKPGPENYFQDRLCQPVVVLSEEESRVLESQLESLGRVLADEGHGYRMELARTIFKLFVLELGHFMLTREYESRKNTSVFGRRDFITTEFLKLVWRHFRTERSVAFYAAKLNITPKHLGRTVKEVLGKTPYEVLSDELVQYASALLRDERLSILDISTRLGFSEQAAFSKFFRKHMGVAPLEFRKSTEVWLPGGGMAGRPRCFPREALADEEVLM